MHEKIWLKNYPQGVPAEIRPEKYKNIVSMLEESFQKFKDRPAFTNMGKTYTYGEIDKLSRDFGAYLQKSLSLKPGDTIAIMMPNTLQYPITLFGAMRAGLVIVNTNPLYQPREMEHQFNDAGVKAIVIVENFAFNLEKIIKHTNIKHVITTSVGDMLGFPKGMIVNFMVRYVKKMVEKYSLPGAIAFSTALREGKKLKLDQHTAKSTDIALLQYTGGTTGVSKGAMLTHRNVSSNMQMISAWLDAANLQDGQEVAIAALPLYHIFAFTVNCLSMCKHGAHNIMITNPRDLDGFIKTLSKYPFTLLTGVNTLFNGLLNKPAFSDLDFSNLKVTVGGGMAVQTAVAERWKKITGCHLSEGYGLTEASPVVTINPIDGTGRVGTIGLPVPSTVIKLVDDDGKEVGIGERGEIIVQGPQVMLGYLNRPEETAKVIKDGWLYTGDIGIMEADGYTQIVDRKKNMILVSGFNVYPNEIEDVVAGHDKVLEVAAIGVPDIKSGEAVKLFVVKKEDSLTKEELKAFCKTKLTGYKVPRHYEFINELPKTNVGKILHRKLKEIEASRKN